MHDLLYNITSSICFYKIVAKNSPSYGTTSIRWLVYYAVEILLLFCTAIPIKRKSYIQYWAVKLLSCHKSTKYIYSLTWAKLSPTNIANAVVLSSSNFEKQGPLILLHNCATPMIFSKMRWLHLKKLLFIFYFFLQRKKRKIEMNLLTWYGTNGKAKNVSIKNKIKLSDIIVFATTNWRIQTNLQLV